MFKTIDSVAVRSEGLVLLLGRLAIGALFLPTGWRKLLDPATFANALGSQYGMIEPLLFWAALAAVVEFFATLAIVVGYKTRLAALSLTVFCVFAAFLGHKYWLADAAQYRNQFVHFWKDIAIAGGLLFLFVRGAGPLSIDRR
jgi:putative oxidoreductase